jgi:hypothetical protein
MSPAAVSLPKLFYTLLLVESEGTVSTIRGHLMIKPLSRNGVAAAAISLLAGHSAAATGGVHEPPVLGISPSEACFYTVSPNNRIAKGLEYVLVITDPGASGYKADDVRYIFHDSAFTVAKGDKKPSQIVGHVLETAINSGVQKAPLFLEDCHRVKSKGTRSAAPDPA